MFQKPALLLPVLFLPLCFPATGMAADAGELARNFKQLPTVPEAELPPLTNALGPFRGVLRHDGMDGHTWVAFPFVENAASLGMDPGGRVFVTEANRFWLGVPDLRGAHEMVRADFKAVTVADRLAMYAKFAAHFPEGWFSAVADRIVRLEDRDGNGAPDHRSLFSDRFREPEDGIGFSVLAEREAVYFTCIPKLWKLTDPDDDGTADTHEALADGFGVRVSFIGHDLHGIVRGPDGRLYFSVGDRSYHVTTADGRVHSGAGMGAVFRCESDGSGLEVVATGLRNPQELGFDDAGNLFTFDNTGDIGDEAPEQRVLAVLFLRRHESPKLSAFLADPDPLVRREAIRALYDTGALDSPAGRSLAALDARDLPEALQRRIVAANYRLGQPENARRMLELAGDASVEASVREFALRGLSVWTAAIETDPVLGHYRPQVVVARPKEQLGNALTGGLRQFLAAQRDPKLVALATRLANDIGVALDEATLRAQVADATLDPDVRVATLESLIRLGKPENDAILRSLLDDKAPAVRAAAIRQGFARKLAGIDAVAREALASGPFEAAHAAIDGLDLAPLGDLWDSRGQALRPELWLDLYLRLQADHSAATKDWTGSPQSLANLGGDAARGERVFRNQGACMQCHLMDGAGGVQGPDLTVVADRLDRAQILASLVEPNAVIAEGYGMSTATLKDGSALIGRLAEQSEKEILLVGLDGTETRLPRADIAALTPPVSAMPPLALTLPLPELRDLVAYLASRTRDTAGDAEEADHGESRDEKIAK